ncbi:MAG: adenylate/guanylate cyclase domain-containing protein, partial [Burkholderiales bacterium]|nr:adenylate/guanylate cyclase domain-containing protein [Burkholderiales bacterium]
MAENTHNLAIVFADVCGSTAMYDHLGDVVAQRLMASCLGCLRTVVTQYGGRVIKTIGDELMCVFSTAQIGIQAACAMQMAVQQTQFEGGNRMQIKVGCHFGPVIYDAGDVFGDTVNVAARVSSTARANQIMTSQIVVDSLPPELRSKAHRIMSAEFKGKQTGFDIYIVAWNADDTDGTQIKAPPQVAQAAPIANASLTLRYRDQQFTVNKDRSKISFGRSDACDIVIPSNLASRQHASVE